MKRNDPPDIDLDVDDKSRQKLLNLLSEHFGHDHFLPDKYCFYSVLKERLAKKLEGKLGIDGQRVSRLIEWSKEGQRFPYAFENDVIVSSDVDSGVFMKQLFEM